jgi:hypothetical protein
VTRATPTVGDLVNHTLHNAVCSVPKKKAAPLSTVAMARMNIGACTTVQREYVAIEKERLYGGILKEKPDNVVWVMFENFSSLGLFVEGILRHKKIRQLNCLSGNYSVDLLVGCKTRTDWRFVTREEDRFCNLFGDGKPTRGICAANTNDGKIKRDQWGGTCMTAIGCFSSFVTDTGLDDTGLGHWSWIYVGGGGKSTRMIVVYQPCVHSVSWRSTRGETVWDQYTRYFEARGEIRNPQLMFLLDLLGLLRRWKAAGDLILLWGTLMRMCIPDPYQRLSCRTRSG